MNREARSVCPSCIPKRMVPPVLLRPAHSLSSRDRGGGCDTSYLLTEDRVSYIEYYLT